MKNRNLLDFFDIGVSKDGRVGITWTDDNNTLEGAQIMFAKVTSGDSLIASKPRFSAAARPARSGDALWPINAQTGSTPDSKSYKGLDLTGETVKLAGDDLKLDVKLASGDLADVLSAGYNSRHIKYVTLWHFADDTYFVAADYDGSNTSVYGGKLDDNDILRNPVTPDASFGSKWVKDFDVTGTMANGVLSFTVPRSSVGDPKKGDKLFSVQSFTIAGLPDDAQTIYTAPDTIDATPPIDYVVGSETSVLGSRRTTNARKSSGTTLPSTGLADTTVLLGMILLAAAAVTWRASSTATQRFRAR
jgi:hypothetical protein